MNDSQAGRLLDLLVNAYPRVTIEAGTADLWLDEFSHLDAAVGERAVRSLIAGCRFFPTIAELNEQLAVVREQQAREREERDRRERERELDEAPRPPLREIPAVVEFRRRNEKPLPFDLGPPGACDECGEHGASHLEGEPGERYRVGKVLVCRDCALRRLAARELVEHEERRSA